MSAPLSSLTTCMFWAGASIGLGLGCLTYGGLGYWIAGTTGLAIGCLIATGFSIAGATVVLRYFKALNDLQQQEAAFLASLANDDCPF